MRSMQLSSYFGRSSEPAAYIEATNLAGTIGTQWTIERGKGMALEPGKGEVMNDVLLDEEEHNQDRTVLLF